MNDELPVPDDRLEDEIFALSRYEAPKPPPREFLPWHRPRKQFVRSKQWAEQIRRLVDAIAEPITDLRYLGLPGIDLLDLRYVHDIICAPRSLPLKFLGFNVGAGNPDAQIEMNISLDEVKKLPYVNPLSDVIADDISAVSIETSMALKRAKMLAPYHVINLDLCDGFGRQSPTETTNTQYNAVNRLLQLQFRSSNPWLLLLTTRCGKTHVHDDVLQKMLSRYLQNLTDCAPFVTLSQTEFAISNKLELENMAETETGHLVVFLTGICKWLLGMVIAANPPWAIELKSVIGYRVVQSAPCEDLVSLALLFSPRSGLIDPLSLANLPTRPPDECELAVKVLRKVSKRVNADELLEQNSNLRVQMTIEMAQLLELARYDRSQFMEWVRKTEGWQIP